MNYDPVVHKDYFIQLQLYLSEISESVKRFLKIDLVIDYDFMVAGKDDLSSVIQSLLYSDLFNFYEEALVLQAKKTMPVFITELESPLSNIRLELQAAVQDRDPVMINLAILKMESLARQGMLNPHLFKRALEDEVRWLVLHENLLIPKHFYEHLFATRRYYETVKLVVKMLSSALTMSSTHKPKESSDPELESIQQYILDHISEHISSVHIANHLNLNPSYFSRYFKKMTNINFSDYIHQFKISVAKNLLKRPGETVENVAYLIGYSDRAYFSKVFKKYTGENPSDYKDR